MESPSRQCYDCREEFEVLDSDDNPFRCQPCQADFRIAESDGKFPESAEAWRAKLWEICRVQKTFQGGS